MDGLVERRLRLCGAAFQIFDDVSGHAGQLETPRRSPVLVGDDPEVLAFARELQDGTDEVLAGGSIDPAGAEGDVRNSTGGQGDLAGEFALSVDVQGRGCVRLEPGCLLRAV